MDRYVIREPRMSRDDFYADNMNTSFQKVHQFEDDVERVWIENYPAAQHSGYMTSAPGMQPVQSSSPFIMYSPNDIGRNYPMQYAGVEGRKFAPPFMNVPKMMTPSPVQHQMQPQYMAMQPSYENRDIMGPERKPLVNQIKANRNLHMAKPSGKPQQQLEQVARPSFTPPIVSAPTPVVSAPPPIVTAPPQESTSGDNKKNPNEPLELRVFSGGVEDVIKWYKTTQELGLFCLFEVVAKLMNIRKGERSAKHMLLRNESGPVLQVVYYEIDFLLPEIKIGSVVRLVGRMTSANKLHAFVVRPANASDVASLSRHSAVASHAIIRLAKKD